MKEIQALHVKLIEMAERKGALEQNAKVYADVLAMKNRAIENLEKLTADNAPYGRLSQQRNIISTCNNVIAILARHN
jgi:hypothetical protein